MNSVLPHRLIRYRFHQQSHINDAAFLVTTVTNNVQVAAAEALTNGLDDPLEFRKIYQHRRASSRTSSSFSGVKTKLSAEVST